ncbi:MAG: hypothetical protein HQ521_10120 [Bacteroidetes bacterium]|nr:hypothetical protein [Bacteroidota bacterium]
MKHSKLLFICLSIFVLTGCEGEDPIPPDSDMPDIFGIFSERPDGVKLDIDSYLGVSFGGGGNFVPNIDAGFIDDENELKEGSKSKRSSVNVGSSGDWALWFVQNGLEGTSDSKVKDMSEYSKGSLKFWVKCEPKAQDLLIKIRSGNVDAGTETSIVNLSNYGLILDNNWHDYKISISDFEGAKPKADLSQIKVFFVIGCSSGDTGGTDGDATFWVDDVRWVK